jgi:membrane fusion protein (multidrug efflux system)
MTKKTKILLFSAIALLIAGMAFYPQIKKLSGSDTQFEAKNEKGSDKQKKSPLTVNALVLRTQPLVERFRSKGIILPDEEVDLSFEASGKITQILFEEGKSVRKGQLLAKVNDKPLQAELKKLESQLPLAKDRLYRQKSLLAKDAVSQEAFETVSTELDKLNADIELVKARINQTELKAPFDGVLGLRLVSEGAYATPQTIVTKLTKISPLKIEFSVNEKQANEIKIGTPISFSVESNNKTYNATVYALESKLDMKTLSLKARASYANSDGKLKAGHSATIDIKLREIKNAIVIPSISSIAEMGRDIVFVYKNGKARQVEIKKGIRTASSLQVLEGLTQGDTLLVSGVMQLRDDMPVTLENVEN